MTGLRGTEVVDQVPNSQWGGLVFVPWLEFRHEAERPRCGRLNQRAV